MLFFISSLTTTPGAEFKTLNTTFNSKDFSNSTLILSQCELKTGTLTVVAVIASFGLFKIYLVSLIIFSSSLVYPFSKNTSICGKQLLNIGYWNFSKVYEVISLD